MWVCRTIGVSLGCSFRRFFNSFIYAALLVLLFFLLIWIIATCAIDRAIYSMIPETTRNQYSSYTLPPNPVCERIKWPITAENFFNDHLKPCKPVVISVPGGLSSLGWKTDRWSEEYLNNLMGDLTVNIEKKVKGQPFGRKSEKIKISFREFLENIYHANSSDPNSDLYYLNLQVGDMGSIAKPPLSYLTTDLNFPAFYLSRPTTGANLWIGSSDPISGANSGLHHDHGDNLYILIKGKKKIRLFSPADSFNVYPVGTILGVSKNGQHSFCGNGESHWSQIDFNRPEQEITENFPRFTDATSVECIVEAGEMLFIPSGWWHQVTSYGIHMAINLWTAPLDA